ncbi:hypothetical protein K470DRAFT_196335, partial [Piedraia hortae CBS 480.64]
ELFNLRYAQLRGAIKRCFGVFKRRFQIFDAAPEFDTGIQIKLICVLGALHNI